MKYTDEKCSILSVIREMQIRTATREHYIATRTAEMKDNFHKLLVGRYSSTTILKKTTGISFQSVNLHIHFNPVALFL